MKKYCLICLKEFETKTSKVYCSLKCRKIKDSQIQKKYYEKQMIKKNISYDYCNQAIKAKNTRKLNKNINTLNIDDLINEFGNIE